jgi:predicted nucleotidyltransferase
MDLSNFLNTLSEISNDDSLLDFCRKTILHGTPYIFLNRESDFYEFRKRIAVKFNIYFKDVYITGSAKLGFSPFKRKEFSYDSDVDVAIISTSLFKKMMNEIWRFQMELRNNRKVVTIRELELYQKFLEYTAMGWIRPDKLPVSFNLDILKDDWFDFFKSISYGKSEVGNYKISAGIFASYEHLEEYACDGLKQLKNSLDIGKL